MHVILLQRVAKLGQMGEVVKVKEGYARNYLLPQGKALRVNAANIARFEAEKAQMEARNLETKKEAEALGEKLDGETFIVIRSASDSGALYGSVTTRDAADAATAAGADKVGAEDLMEDMLAGNLDYDRVIATPDMMGIVGRLGKTLGPKGLMPNPKLGTVTMDVAEAVKAAKAGQVEFRVEKQGIIHSGIGKKSFSDSDLRKNFDALVDAVIKNKPSGSKGKYVRRVAVSSSMGPGLKIDLADVPGA